ncbi:hypothetical protein [Nitrosopumilus piranensis]|uniref:Uncharacterized protein n=1 Tax=Nitrosopumilus piranensis TaxID=1582439 RepID=A0A0C5C073_9ARCH|nr:hypothetical protein [Nitrosopumilus piranensis]AJM92700.1 hypothetical protein NPIRD3C_1488 [Nitrosopumilus piranensis]
MSEDIISQLEDAIRQRFITWTQNIRFALPVFVTNENQHYTPHAFDISVPSTLIRPDSVSVDKLDERVFNRLQQIEMAHFINHFRSLELELTSESNQANLYDTLEQAFTSVNEIERPDTILIPRNRLSALNDYIRNLRIGQSVILRDNLNHVVYEGESNEFYIYSRENITKIFPKDKNQRLILNIDHDEGFVNPSRFWGHIQQELMIRNIENIARITVNN